MVENKNKIPTFLVENKNFSQNFDIAYEKMCFDLDPDPDWDKIPGSGSVKNESGPATLVVRTIPEQQDQKYTVSKLRSTNFDCNLLELPKNRYRQRNYFHRIQIRIRYGTYLLRHRYRYEFLSEIFLYELEKPTFTYFHFIQEFINFLNPDSTPYLRIPIRQTPSNPSSSGSGVSTLPKNSKAPLTIRNAIQFSYPT